MPEVKDKTQRRVYVLPTELVERIVAYQTELGLHSEVEAARRLLDDALKQRDTFATITTKLIAKKNETKSLREAAREVLADHPLVTSITFQDDELNFTLKNGYRVEVFSWGVATVYDQDSNLYDFSMDLEPTPAWASHKHPRPKPIAPRRPGAPAEKPNYDLDDDPPF